MVPPAKIMVRATNWIGDGVMMTPALGVLRQQFPEAEIVIVANPLVAHLFNRHPWCDRVLVLDRRGASRGVVGLIRFARMLRTERFGLAVLFQKAFEAALLALAQSDQIPDSEWPTISEILTGDRQLRIGNPAESPQRTGSLRGANPYATHTIVDRQVQVLYSVNYSAVLSPADVSTRLDLISRMLDASLGPAANIALARAQKLLIDFHF